MEKILRTDYMAWLESFRDKPLIKVLTGMRRVGKSTCLQMFADRLHASGIPSRQIVTLNFEELEYEDLRDSTSLEANTLSSSANTI